MTTVAVLMQSDFLNAQLNIQKNTVYRDSYHWNPWPIYSFRVSSDLSSVLSAQRVLFSQRRPFSTDINALYVRRYEPKAIINEDMQHKVGVDPVDLYYGRSYFTIRPIKRRRLWYWVLSRTWGGVTLISTSHRSPRPVC